MLFLKCGLFIVLFFGTNAEMCKYEFVVPDNNCKSIGTPVSAEDEPHSIMHMQTGIDTTNARLNSITEVFSGQFTKLTSDSKDLKEVTKQMKTKLDSTRESIARLEGFMDEVKSWKSSLSEGSSPKLATLQSQMLDIAAKFQSQSSVQTSIYSSLQRQLAETVTSIGRHARDIDNLKDTVKTVESLKTKVDTISEQSRGSPANLQNIEGRLGSLEEKIDLSLPRGNSVNEMKVAINLIQRQFLDETRTYRTYILNLNGSLNKLQSEMEALKAGVKEQ
ncbi:Hypothetical predicted protein [Mytilus galloprovincialis]|uniref:Uncharacterized protein n=1 Tax=Mytilus galloprovincialis TaxID=29158 RepID=A0A8B6DXE3_MYTGA|nr:Hypothetical predicted protein [Mytilus galloprovincialis]